MCVCVCVCACVRVCLDCIYTYTYTATLKRLALMYSFCITPEFGSINAVLHMLHITQAPNPVYSKQHMNTTALVGFKCQCHFKM